MPSVAIQCEFVSFSFAQCSTMIRRCRSHSHCHFAINCISLGSLSIYGGAVHYLKCNEKEWSKAKTHIIYQYLYNDTNQANQKKEMNTFSNDVTSTQPAERTNIESNTQKCWLAELAHRKRKKRAGINVNIPSMCRSLLLLLLLLFFIPFLRFYFAIYLT